MVAGGLTRYIGANLELKAKSTTNADFPSRKYLVKTWIAYESKNVNSSQQLATVTIRAIDIHIIFIVPKNIK